MTADGIVTWLRERQDETEARHGGDTAVAAAARLAHRFAAAHTIERQAAEIAAKDAEIERLRKLVDRNAWSPDETGTRMRCRYCGGIGTHKEACFLAGGAINA